MTSSLGIRLFAAAALSPLAAACSGGSGTPIGVPAETREPAHGADDPSHAAGGEPARSSDDSAGCVCTGGTYTCTPQGAASANVETSTLVLASNGAGCDVVGSKGQSVGSLLCDGRISVDGALAPQASWRSEGSGAFSLCAQVSDRNTAVVCFDCALRTTPVTTPAQPPSTSGGGK